MQARKNLYQKSHGAKRNGAGAPMRQSKVPRIISLKFAKPGSPVSVYSRVRSTSRNKIHIVTRVRGERRFNCTCERGVLRDEHNCLHIKKVKLRIAAKASR